MMVYLAYIDRDIGSRADKEWTSLFSHFVTAPPGTHAQGRTFSTAAWPAWLQNTQRHTQDIHTYIIYIYKER